MWAPEIVSDSFKKRITCLRFYGGKKAFWKKDPIAKKEKAELCSTCMDNSQDQKVGEKQSKAKAMETD
jgi:hypothetical protein